MLESLLNKVIEQIITEAGMVGLFSITGWVFAIVLSSAVAYFFVWRMQVSDFIHNKAIQEINAVIANIEKHNSTTHEEYRRMIKDRDDIMHEVIEKVTTNNTQIVERLTNVQMIMIQLIGKQ